MLVLVYFLQLIPGNGQEMIHKKNIPCLISRICEDANFMEISLNVVHHKISFLLRGLSSQMQELTYIYIFFIYRTFILTHTESSDT